jgi:hypothetical protein
VGLQRIQWVCFVQQQPSARKQEPICEP